MVPFLCLSRPRGSHQREEISSPSWAYEALPVIFLGSLFGIFPCSPQTMQAQIPSGTLPQVQPPRSHPYCGEIFASKLSHQRDLGTCSVETSQFLFLHLPKLHFICLIGIWLLHNVLVSAIQQSDSATHKHISSLSCNSFLFRLPQDIE